MIWLNISNMWITNDDHGYKSGTTVPDSEGDAVSTAAPSRRLLAFEALKIRHFRYLLVSDFFQMLGFNTRLMVQGWIVLELTDSDGWVGLVAGLPAIPVIILALFGGAISDRVNRRVIQIWTFLLLALSGYVLGLLVQTEAIRLWHLIAMAFPVSMMATLRMTAGSAMVIDVVGRGRIFGANTLSTALGNVGRFVGPGVGGWVLANHGAGIAFYGIGSLLLLSAVLIWFVKVENPPISGQKKSLMEDFKLGIRYISGTPELRWLSVLALAVMFVGMAMPLFPRWSRDVLGTGAEGYGFILAAGGVGGLVGAAALIFAPPFNQLARVLVIVVAIYSLAIIGFAFTSSLIMAALAYSVIGATVAWWANTVRTMFQLASKDEMRGRVMSLFGLISQTIAFGWLIGGLVSEAIGPPDDTHTLRCLSVLPVFLRVRAFCRLEVGWTVGFPRQKYCLRENRSVARYQRCTSSSTS